MGATLCIKACGEGSGPTIVEDPNYGNLTYSWGPCSDQ
jgi:hypothetical protein